MQAAANCVPDRMEGRGVESIALLASEVEKSQVQTQEQGLGLEGQPKHGNFCLTV